MSRFVECGKGWLGFHRLAIMGLSPNGMQPFRLDGDMCVCNGELYGFRPIKTELVGMGYRFQSGSDCEILLPMYREYVRTCSPCWMRSSPSSSTTRAATSSSPRGTRWVSGRCITASCPQAGMVFASEAKNLVGLCPKIMPFPPGHYWDGEFHRYADLTTVSEYCRDDEETACRHIRELLIQAVDKRLDSDAPLGFLLSGGLDSSLVCSIATRLLQKPIRTFAIGMDTDPIDLKYAAPLRRLPRQRAHGDNHDARGGARRARQPHRHLGTYDITTIRASLGMYLCCKAIHERTDVRVLLTGEISDELFGYKYTDFAPTPEDFRPRAKSASTRYTCTTCCAQTAVSA